MDFIKDRNLEFGHDPGTCKFINGTYCFWFLIGFHFSRWENTFKLKKLKLYDSKFLENI